MILANWQEERPKGELESALAQNVNMVCPVADYHSAAVNTDDYHVALDAVLAAVGAKMLLNVSFSPIKEIAKK